MKKLLLAIIILGIVAIVFSTTAYAATCSNSTENICGPLGGCGYGTRCVSYLSGGYGCQTDSACPTQPVTCPSTSVPDCLLIKNPPLGATVGTPCSTAGYTCQIQGNICGCVLTPTSTPTPTITPSITPSVTPSTTPSITPSLTPTPTISPVPINKVICPNNGTIYPPNSNCYSEPKKVERIAIDLVDSNQGILTYPISCISAPTVTYNRTYTGTAPLPDTTENVTVNTDISNVQLGFLGPDSTTLAGSNPDTLAKKYLFNSLFDKPGAQPNNQKESFRTFWRMLDSLSQAQLKAYYLENTKDYTYYYVGTDFTQHPVKIEDIKNSLNSATCLKTFSDKSCWKDDKYVTQYQSLNQTTKDEYDALLPFDFNNMRAYVSSGSDVSSENIPYLQAIMSGLKGYRNDILGFPNVVIPGLFDYYTPEWARRNLALYPTLSTNPVLLDAQLKLYQYPIIKFVASLDLGCSGSVNNSPKMSPKTYPDHPITTQTVTVPVTSVLTGTTPGYCMCPPGDYYCYLNDTCTGYGADQTACLAGSCSFHPGINIYNMTGKGVGKPITVFNNPYITSLTDLVIGGKPLISNSSTNPFAQFIIDLINAVSDRLIAPVQPSFYKMLLPDFASNSAAPKALVGATGVTNTSSDANAAVSGSDTISRENNLAEDSMYLLQNCWFVPSDQQSSSKCSKATVGTCDGTKMKALLAGSYQAPTSAALSYFYTYIVPKLTPEVISAYSAAEKATGVPCEVFAGIHFEEGGNDPGRSLQDGSPLSGKTLEQSAIQAGQELNGKAGGQITGLDNLISALSRYNGGGNSNCQASTTCTAASSLTRCGQTVACATDTNSCVCANPTEAGSCHSACGTTAFPWPIPYSYCTPFPKEGYSDPYVTDMWLSPQNDTMYLLYQYDCTQTKPIPHARPGTLTVALSLYSLDTPNP